MATRPPSPATDPRLEESARPIVATPATRLPLWLGAGAIAAGGLMLFAVLDANRRSLSAPPVKPRYADTTGEAPPVAPLFIPPEPPPVVVAPPAPPAPRIVYVPQPAPPPVTVAPPPPPRATSEPAMVIDTTVGEAAAPAEAGGEAAVAAARASVMRHRPTTVAQGTLIPAVLESALDSTRPGPARAIVSRDVRGFDGMRVLIPRGSRLIGEYRADLQPGQKRAQIMWTRLVRPDGVMIALGSPAADPLGRVGVKGSVNSHFFERFAMAVLQTSLDVGVNLASRGSGSAVILALPGSVGSAGVGQLTQGQQIQPTLRVKQGTAIAVFVARDLDFASVEARK